MTRRGVLWRTVWTGALVMLMAGGVLTALDDDKQAAAVDGTHVVMDNFSFTPPRAVVPVGTTVTWTNHDDIPHNVVSPERTFKSPALDIDEVFSHTFTVAGTYKYYCSIHPRMTGQIVVR